MITIRDFALVHTSNGNRYVLIEDIRHHGKHTLYDIAFKFNGNVIRDTINESDVIEEAYWWYDVSHITNRHPTPEDLQKCKKFLRTATEISVLRRQDPKIRVRLRSGVDTKQESDRLAKIVFDAQDNYELTTLGLEDTHDSFLKLAPDPTTHIKMKDLVRTEQKLTNECHNFSCSHCKMKHCEHPVYKVDVNRCSKQVEPHTGEFSNESDTYYMEIAGLARNETDQLEE